MLGLVLADILLPREYHYMESKNENQISAQCRITAKIEWEKKSRTDSAESLKRHSFSLETLRHVKSAIPRLLGLSNMRTVLLYT